MIRHIIRHRLPEPRRFTIRGALADLIWAVIVIGLPFAFLIIGD